MSQSGSIRMLKKIPVILSLVVISGCSTHNEASSSKFFVKKPVEKKRLNSNGNLYSHTIEKGLYRLTEYFNNDGSLLKRSSYFLDPEKGINKKTESGRQLKFNGDGWVSSSYLKGRKYEFNNPEELGAFWVKPSRLTYGGRAVPAVAANDKYMAILYGEKKARTDQYRIRFAVVNLEENICELEGYSGVASAKFGGESVELKKKCETFGITSAEVYTPSTDKDNTFALVGLSNKILHKIDEFYVEIDGEKIPFKIKGISNYLHSKREFDTTLFTY